MKKRLFVLLCFLLVISLPIIGSCQSLDVQPNQDILNKDILIKAEIAHVLNSKEEVMFKPSIIVHNGSKAEISTNGIVLTLLPQINNDNILITVHSTLELDNIPSELNGIILCQDRKTSSLANSDIAISLTPSIIN